MTFEQLQQIAAEQETRMFSMKCILTYFTYGKFNDDHLLQLKDKFIYDACLATLTRINFPFESIAPSVDFVYGVKKDVNGDKKISYVNLKFYIYILNLPELNIAHMNNLTACFPDYYTYTLKQDYFFPLDIKNSLLVLQFRTNHSLFKVLHDNNLI